MADVVRIGEREVGDGRPVFVIAEIGLNHNGDPELAAQLVRTAAAAGVDAVKFQKRDTKALITQELYDSPYTAWYSYGTTYGEHREALELSVEDLAKLQQLSESLNVVFFASAWDLPSVEVCEELGVPVYKVASADVTNIPLLERLAETGKPLIMSTGMSTEDEIATAVDVIRRHHDQLVLLHCVSTYPSEFDEINLATIPWLRTRFDCPVGYSGHERGIAVSSAAVAIGSCVVERHFTLDRAMKGPDHAASLEPPGLMKLVRDIRAIEKARGAVRTGPVEREIAVRAKLGKSLVAARDLPAGHALSAADLVAKSPGTGVAPNAVHSLVGRVLNRDLAADELVKLEDLQSS
jgi:N-acetylneuraminate synthase/sialic acid synthase